jgi:hypothetical protein
MLYADDTELTFSQPWGHTCNGRALCPDGRVRAFRGGTADTFFSIPARVSAHRTTVAGYVTVEARSGSSVATDDDPAVVRFQPYLYRKNHALVEPGNEARCRLERHAARSAGWRGHRLGAWQVDGTGRCSVALCLDCSMGAYVDTAPPPNGIDISGKAVALNCTGKEA